jgi:Ca2+-binding RTX toxin-like protein
MNLTIETLESRTLFSILHGPITNPDNGHLYYLLDPATWTASEAEAKKLGGHLVTVNNQAEEDFVFNNFHTVNGTARNLWIGLNDMENEGDFVWASGAPVTYTNWYAGEPNNANGVEDFTYIVGFNIAVGKWNDLRNDTDAVDNNATKTAGVVEVLPGQANLRGNKLLITGTGKRDTITVSEDGSDLVVKINNDQEIFSKQDVSKIQVFGFDGADRITIKTDTPSELYGHAGKDTLRGGPGDDKLDGGAGGDLLRGRGGIDTADYSTRDASVFVFLDDLANDGEPAELDNVRTDIENILGGAGNDMLQGSSVANKLVGGGGDDYLFGAGGADRLLGNAGRDILVGGPGADDLLGGPGIDQLFDDE